MVTRTIMTMRRNGPDSMGLDHTRDDNRKLGQAASDATDTGTSGNVGSREGLTQSPSSEGHRPSFQHLLFTWLSPAFPVGAFAYSHGLEMAAERLMLTTHASLENWLAALITQGSLQNDLLLVAHAYRAAAASEHQSLASVNALARALQPSAERYLETTQQGGSFLIAIAAAWPHPAIAGLQANIVGDVAYPVAVGMSAAVHGIALDATLQAYAFAFTGNLTSAAIRLGIIGQTAAQMIIAALAPLLHKATLIAEHGTLDDIGSATFSADLCSLEHETQYSRLFRS